MIPAKKTPAKLMKFQRILIVLVLSFVVIASNEQPAAAEFDILYFERPPYYMTLGKESAGLLNDLTRRIFVDAGINFNFYSMPPKRIIKVIEIDRRHSCSPGWFKNVERHDFASFTLPFYQSSSMVILSNRKDGKKISRHQNVESLIKDRELILGKMTTFSYGHYLDELLARYRPKQFIVNSSQKQLIRLLGQSRINYIIITPEEVDTLIDSVQLNRKDFVQHSLSGLPKGNKRFLMCNRSVEENYLDRLNRSIKRLVPPETWSD